MAVVINELEMSPAPTAKSQAGGDSSTEHEGPPTLAPDVLRQIEKALKSKQERNYRLTAY